MLRKLIEEVVLQELTSIISERRRAKPQIMYHGTSSKFLSKIFQLGMVPNPSSGRWKEENGEAKNVRLSGSAGHRSLRSLEGSYWTTNIFVAGRSANDAAKYSNGERIIVIAQIVPQTAKADEDSIDGAIDRAFREANQSLYGARDSTSYAIELQGRLDADNLVHGNLEKTLVDNFSNILHNSLKFKNDNKMPIDKQMFRQTYHAILERILGYTEIEFDKWRYLEGYKQELEKNKKDPEEIEKLVEDKKNNLPKYNTEEGERNLSKMLDKITGRYKKTTFETTDELSVQTNLRVTQPVGFSGRNKIIAILKNVPSAKRRGFSNTFTLVYGKTVPKKFIDDWTKSYSPYLTVLDTEDRILYKA